MASLFPPSHRGSRWLAAAKVMAGRLCAGEEGAWRGSPPEEKAPVRRMREQRKRGTSWNSAGGAGRAGGILVGKDGCRQAHTLCIAGEGGRGFAFVGRMRVQRRGGRCALQQMKKGKMAARPPVEEERLMMLDVDGMQPCAEGKGSLGDGSRGWRGTCPSPVAVWNVQIEPGKAEDLLARNWLEREGIGRLRVIQKRSRRKRTCCRAGACEGGGSRVLLWCMNHWRMIGGRRTVVHSRGSGSAPDVHRKRGTCTNVRTT
ncbi:unnamed protein product [Victoria cruziana]